MSNTLICSLKKRNKKFKSKSAGEIVFTTTPYYNHFKEKYGFLENLCIPHRLFDIIQPETIHPIMFSENSVLYFAKIISIQMQDNKSTVSCRIYVRKSDFYSTQCRIENQKYFESHLLMSSKIIKFSMIFFLTLLIATQSQQWDKNLNINDLDDLKKCKINILNKLEYTIVVSCHKAKLNSIPYRRLPKNLSDPGNKFLNSTKISPNLKLEDFFVQSQNFYGYSSDFYNFLQSLSILKIQPDGKNSNGSHNKNGGEIIFKQTEENRDPTYLPVDIRSSLRRKIKPPKRIYDQIIQTKKIVKVSKSKKSNGFKNKKNTIIKEEIDKTENHVLEEAGESEVNIEFTEKNLEDNSNNISSHIDSDDSRNEVMMNPSKEKLKHILSLCKTREDFDNHYVQYYKKNSKPIPRIPKMGWLEVDIFKLFRETVERGGFHKVTRQILWKSIYKALNSDTVVSNAATTVKTHYKKLLYDFEYYLLTLEDNSNNKLFETNNNSIEIPKIIESNKKSDISNQFMMDSILNKKDPELISSNKPNNEVYQNGFSPRKQIEPVPPIFPTCHHPYMGHNYMRECSDNCFYSHSNPHPPISRCNCPYPHGDLPPRPSNSMHMNWEMDMRFHFPQSYYPHHCHSPPYQHIHHHFPPHFSPHRPPRHPSRIPVPPSHFSPLDSPFSVRSPPPIFDHINSTRDFPPSPMFSRFHTPRPIPPCPYYSDHHHPHHRR